MTRLIALVLTTAFTLAACASDGAPPSTPDAAAERAGAPRPPATAVAAPATEAAAAGLPLVTVYKSPTCGCCSAWVEHLRASGFPVEAVDVPSTDAVHEAYGIPPALRSCHTGVVEGYVVEGHVPAEDVKRLLAERPEAGGLAVPGMPVGSPGMEQGDVREPYEVLLVDDGRTSVFARH